MIQVGAERHPTYRSGKILMLAWSTFSLIVVATYTANLAAFFTNRESDKPLCSVVDLERSKLNASTFKELKGVFTTVNNPIIKHLLKRRRLNFDLSIDENMNGHILTSLETGHVFIAYETSIEIVKREIPTLYTLDGYFTFASEGFVLKKNHRMFNKIASLFTNYEAEGFFQAVKRKYLNQIGCGQQLMEKSPVKAIPVGNLWEVIVILGTFAIISLLLELAVHFYSNWVHNRPINIGG